VIEHHDHHYQAAEEIYRVDATLRRQFHWLSRSGSIL
jgi:hypothetical protein